MPRGNDLERMQRDLSTAQRRVMGVAARAVEASLRESIDQGYQTGTDVNGKAYLPPKDGHLPPMIRSGKLRRAYRYSILIGALVYTIRASENTEHGEYLRDGTGKMRPRQHIPQPGSAMPAAWDSRARLAVTAAVQGERARS